ncbi:TPA: hypothetical protein ACIX52_001562 [Escherichia coli]
MNISTETREILRNYKAVINARRREMGQKPLTTAQIVDRRVVVEYADRLEHAVNILVILQVACAASAFAHPSHLLM